MRRVVISGIGVVAPNGVGKDAFWKACVNGRSGVGPIRQFDASTHPVRVAAEVPDFDLSPYFEIVKPTLEEGFDYKGLTWARDPRP